MKKLACGLIACLMICSFFIQAYAAETRSKPTRVINVVYDDSGSMYRSDNGQDVDTWCQAKYSMEVFAAMLGDTDTLHIYYMSDYRNGTDSAPRIVLYGKDGAATNVGKLHRETTRAGNTPFNSVRKAYADLSKAKADEKWLVVLTDGAFEDGRLSKSEIDAFFAAKNTDISVMFLAMGPDAAGITAKENQNIFYSEARTNNQILKQITGICTRIFNSDRLDVNASTKRISFDIPMGELIVFAQGANVQINGIKKSDGTLVKSAKTPVEVKYSECDATNYHNAPAKDLVGRIATFIDDFDSGDYTVDVTGAETIEIYYKPNIEVAAYLTDSNGNEVTDMERLEAGEYNISFGFVKAGTKERVRESKLLGKVEYEAVVQNNGKRYDRVSSGDKVTLAEGTLAIDVLALYLEYHTVSTHLEYLIYKDKHITFSFINDPVYTIASDGTVNDDYIEVEAKINGESVTEEEWSAMIVPEITLEKVSRSFKIDEPAIEKTETPGIYRIRPGFPDGKPSNNKYENCNYTIKYNQKTGNDTWYGSTDGTIKFDDTRSWLVSFSVINDPTYTIDSNGIETSKSIEVEAKIDGRSITPEEWAQMNVPTIALERDSRDFKIDEPVIEKTETPGIYRIRPVIPGGKPSTGTYKDCNYTLKYQQEIDGENWSGEADGTIKLNDTRSWWERNWDLFVKLIILAIILFILAGYLPFIKHYLPKSLKKKPYIKCIPNEPGEQRKDRNGVYSKNLMSTIIPYVPQTGTIKIVPKGVTGAPPMSVRAIKRRRMTLTNVKAYAGKDYITFDGEAIKKDCKKFDTGAAVTVRVKRGEWTYVCSPNQSGK